MAIRISRLTTFDNDPYVTESDLVDRLSLEKYVTSFKVYANASPIQVGTNHPVLGLIQASPYNNGASLPAQMTCKFATKSLTPNAESDVVVDWGDGAKTIVATDELDWTQTDSDGEIVNVLAHTYASEGKYNVRVFGLGYFGISNWLGIATQNSNYANDNLDYNKECNLLCECFSSDCELGANVTNLAAFARCSQRLTKVEVQCQRFLHVKNTANAFLSCWNLASFTGVGKYIPSTRNCSGMFNDCRNMVECDYVLPANTNDISALNSVFNNCNRLASDISKLIPTAGFSAKKLQMSMTFRLCSSLTGKIPAHLLWEDKSIDWQNTNTCFYGCSLASTGPSTWGGSIQYTSDEDVRSGLVLDIPMHDDLIDRNGNNITVIKSDASSLPLVDYHGRRCAHFDGDAALVIPAPNGGSFDFYSSGQMTLCFWFSKPASSTWESFMNKRANGGTADYYFGFNIDKPCFYNGTAYVSSTSASKSIWHFVCFRIGMGGYLEWYLDGKDMGTLVSGNTVFPSQSKPYLMIGGCCYAGDPRTASIGNCVELLHAYISDIRIYNRYLDISEVDSIMSITSVGNAIKTVEYIPAVSETVMLHGDNAYMLRMNGAGSGYNVTTTLTCENTPNVTRVWLVDIIGPDVNVVSYDPHVFNVDECDPITAGKINRCIVKWDGTEAILYCYRVDDM